MYFEFEGPIVDWQALVGISSPALCSWIDLAVQRQRGATFDLDLELSRRFLYLCFVEDSNWRLPHHHSSRVHQPIRTLQHEGHPP